jgi:hypothetical protein
VTPNRELADPRERYRPHDSLTLRREVLRLSAEGLTRSDVIHLLKLSETFVREVLGELRL